MEINLKYSEELLVNKMNGLIMSKKNEILNDFITNSLKDNDISINQDGLNLVVIEGETKYWLELYGIKITPILYFKFNYSECMTKFTIKSFILKNGYSIQNANFTF
jgi:hypothetical protein